MNLKLTLWGVLFLLAGVGLTILPNFESTLPFYKNQKNNAMAWQVLENFSEEFIGAGLSFILFNAIVDKLSKEQEKQNEIQQQQIETARYKERLRAQLASPVLHRKAEAVHELKNIKKWGFGEDRTLHNVDLVQAELQQLDFSGINLVGARMREINGSEMTLTEANLSESDLSNALLVKATMDRANLTSAILQGTDCSGASFIRANLINTDLENANLTNTDLLRANFKGANVKNANLSGADLSGADLSGCLNLEQANLERAKYNRSTKWPRDFNLEDNGAVSVD